ncbi:MAG: M14 family metallopeptidase [Calditrichia bacterium]
MSWSKISSLMLLNASLLFLLNSCNGTTTPPDPTAGLFHNYAEVNQKLQSFQNTHPQIAAVSSIGQSLEGRQISALKISDNVSQDEDEPVVIFFGAHHAREWISVDVPLLTADHLLNAYGSDTLITRLIDNAEVWFVPMVNPDGHQYSVTTNRLWRKNRRDNGDGTFGVDLNRNYGYQWGGPGSSGDSFSETYRGPSAFSEPESRAVRDFLNREQPKAMITYHSYSQLVLYPWGHTNAPTPDDVQLDQLASAMAAKILAVHGKSYTPQQASDLYLASGDTADWLYAVQNAMAFTIELRPRSRFPGFELPDSEIQPTFEENLPAALYLIDWAIGNTP